jgi:hypothetical protein
MATTQKTNPITENIENAAERVAELNEKALENGKKAGAAYLDSYEKAVVQFADGYEKAAQATRIDWVSTVAATQADFAREVTKAYTSAARELVTREAPTSVVGSTEPRRSAAALSRSSRPAARHEGLVDLDQRLALTRRQRLVGLDRGDDRRFLVGLVGFAGLVSLERLGRHLEVLGDRLEHTLRRLTQSPLDLGQVRVGDADQVRKLAHRELVQLPLTADVLAERGLVFGHGISLRAIPDQRRSRQSTRLHFRHAILRVP